MLIDTEKTYIFQFHLAPWPIPLRSDAECPNHSDLVKARGAPFGC